ncbi:MAG: hypothetical protein HY960_07635 [Ignavibacteriae bacterium]|nr:hypothetical protein [Ignavibacteriota bacterium]
MAIVLMVAGCAPSFVYSPSLDLPAKSVGKNNIQLNYGFIGLPETRPDDAGQKISWGTQGTARFGFSNSISGQLRIWKDGSDNVAKGRGGLSFGAIFMLNDSTSATRIGLGSIEGFVWDEKEVGGGGGMVPVIFWFPPSNHVSVYAAIGPAIGIRNLYASESKKHSSWGLGIITNAGVALYGVSVFQINAEMTGIFQLNNYDSVGHLILSPSISLSLNF